MFKTYVYLAVMLGFLLSACSEGEIPVDGDFDKDQEAETENPCDASYVDCSPGTCILELGYAKCNCPGGYEISGYKCVVIADGDKDNEADSEQETEVDEDLDKDPDENDIVEHESCGSVTDGPFKGIACCKDVENSPPCVSDMEFSYTNDNGEFRISFEDLSGLWISGIWQDYILFTMTKAETYGFFLFNYKSKTVIRLGHPTKGTLHAHLRDNTIMWSETEEMDQVELTEVWSSLWTSSLKQIIRTKLPTSETAKFQQQVFEDDLYWIAVDYQGSDSQVYLYTMNENGQEEVVGNSTKSIASFSTYGNNILWKNSGNELIKYDLTTKQETFIFDHGWGYSDPIATANKVYITDLTSSPDPSSYCGASINAFDLNTFERTTIKQNVGLTDYAVSDVWEDWMVYVNCNEGNPDPEKDDRCCTGWGHGDVFLYNLTTKEEWPISASFGDQGDARMWGPLIIWHDGRHRENGEGHALYGIDLCLHPELKSKFDECKSR